MAEMFGKRRPVLTGKELHTATVKANRNLRAKNEKLKELIKSQEDTLAGLGANCVEVKESIRALKKDNSSIKSQVKKMATEYAKKTTLANEIDAKINNGLKEEERINSDIAGSIKDSEGLKKSIVKMHDELSLVSSLKSEIKLLKSDYKNEEKKISTIQKELHDYSVEVEDVKSVLDKKRKLSKKAHADMGKKHKELEKELGTIDNKHTIRTAEHNTKISTLKDSIKALEGEESVLKSIVEKREHDFISIETELAQATGKLEYTKELTAKEIEMARAEKEKVQKAIDRIKQNILEEVARLKLKKKIELIDEGLKDIMNG